MLCDAKGKDERKNRSVARASWKRDSDVCASSAASPPRAFLPPRSPSPPCTGPAQSRGAMAENNINKNISSSGGNANSAAGAAKKHRAPDKMEPLFSLPSCTGSGSSPPCLSSALSSSSSLPLSSSPSSLSHKPLPLSSSSVPLSSLRPPPQVRTRSVGTNTQDRSVEWEMQRGPCLPGTSVNLEGIVWHETEEGVLVVNVTWRKRTYVGTLLDCTKHDWAPPRFCDSPCSDPELPGGRGRGKRLRLALSDRSCLDSSPAAKIRTLTSTPHRSRGGGSSTSSLHKGRRASLNLISTNGRSSFFTVDEVKSNGLSGKRKNKPPVDLDLSLVRAEDIKNANGKRIRAKSRSAPSTPQGKSDPTFMDPGGGGLPMLIDCPHPNCNKRYKHINGLRYHQTHAHLDSDEQKQEADIGKNADIEDRLSDCEDGIVNYDISETKKTPLYKVTTVGSPKSRRLLLSTEQNSKTRRTSLLKDGLIDDLTNLPIISNMTVVLENCMVPDRNNSVEMPKLEAEGLIDKKSKKTNGKVEKMSKSRINRPIAPAPAPPKLIAIPNTSYGTNAENSQQPPLSFKMKNLPLKPIKPKLSIVVEPSLVKAALVGCSKELKKKEKKRLKEKLAKEVANRAANGENCKIVEENGTKMALKEIPGSLLKEHLSKQEVLNGETTESRMASIRAEADKVYTFTDNAPSPSIGGSSRVDGCSVDSKNNSPAYSDISDAGEDAAAKSASSDVSANANPAKNVAKENPQSAYYHGYDSYYLQGYTERQRQKKDEVKDEDKEFAESKKSELQLAMSQTALAQSLYYGQYSRGLYVDQKLVLGSKCCDVKARGREAEERMCKDSSTVKSPKAAHQFVEVNERTDRGQQRDELPQTHMDSSAPYATPPDGAVWRSFMHGKYLEEETAGAVELQEREGKGELSQQRALCEDSQSARAAMSPPSPQNYAQYHPNTHPNSHPNTHPNSHPNSHPNTHPNSHPNSHSNTHPNSHPNSHPSAYQPYLPGISEPTAGSYRGLSPTLVHSYPGFHYPLYGKTAGREEQEAAVTRGGAVSSKHSDSAGLELLSPPHQCHGKSPAPGEKGSPETDSDRSHMSFGRHLHNHHSALSYEIYTESDGKK